MGASAEVALGAFVAQQKRLLGLELRAEEEAAPDAGTSKAGGNDDGRDGGFVLRNIDVADTSVGTVRKDGGGVWIRAGDNEDGASGASNDRGRSSALLPAHRLTVGDEVRILPNNGRGDQVGKQNKHAERGVVQKAGEKGGKEEEPDDDGDMLGGNPPYALIPKSNVEVHQKMILALEELERQGVGHPVAGEIILAAFEPSNPKPDTDMSRERRESLEAECGLSSTRLDFSQREAVVMALHSNSPISLIHGPPGTGKTTTVAELIRCAVHQKGWKVLVTAPSNVAVDNVLDRIVSLEDEQQSAGSGKRKAGSKKASKQKRIKAVRLGHPARIQHGIQKYSLESLVQSSEGTEIVKDCRSELNEYLKTLSNARSRPSEKRLAYREMKSLRKEIRSREERVVGEILRESNVVLATNVGAASSVFRRMVDAKGEPMAFDLVIIDEAAQALEASCWISLLRGKRAVLAGDHKQLPPTIKCTVSEVQRELGRTLFERLMFAYEKGKSGTGGRSKMLEVQYRMHKHISDWASKAMYNRKLISHASVKDRKLSGLPMVAAREGAKNVEAENDALEDVTLLLVDTTGCDMHETANEAGSRYNEGEASIVVSHVQSSLALGLRAEDIAVITPYNGQVELLRKRLLPDTPKLEIRSVDGFQGGEREAVVLSLVRSSERGGKNGIGFLRDERRLNVAVTRAKRHCAVICDCETVSKNKFIKGLVDWMEEKGEYRSGAEYVTEQQGVGSCESLQLDGTDARSKLTTQSVDKQAKSKKGQSTKPAKEKVAFEDDVEDAADSLGVSNNKAKVEATRRALMQRINAFADSGAKGDELTLSSLSDYECVLARELAAQLGLGRREGKSANELTLCVLKRSKVEVGPPAEEDDPVKNTSKFAQLDIDDSSESDDGEAGAKDGSSSLLQQLALEREKRQSEQQHKIEAAKPTAPKKKAKKKKSKAKGQRLGGASKPTQTDNDSNTDELDDMAFLDAQIEKVQTSHGRKIEAKGKGYRSVVNGILLAKPPSREEPKKANNAAAANLQAKLKAKSQDRKVKKKPK
ncbi:hypothetical protein ACHAXT_008057 [Thalassiosira profunda]